MLTKICTKCKTELPATIEYFSKHRQGKNGLRPDCKACERARNKAYRKNHKQKLKQYFLDHYHQNKDSVLLRNKQYRNDKKEVINVQRKQYRQDNKDRLVERRKKFYSENKDKVLSACKEYRERNKDAVKQRLVRYLNTERGRALKRIRQHDYRARKSVLLSDFTIEQWELCLNYFNKQCVYCGKDGDLTQEHVVPVKKGGGYTASNIVPACRRCNNSKQDKDFLNWYRKQEFYSIDREMAIKLYLEAIQSQMTGLQSILKVQSEV